MGYPKKVVIFKANFLDIKGICKVHIESFENYLSALLGEKFLTIHYNHYLKYPEKNILIVAKRGNGVVCGFAGGTIDINTFNKSFFWENLRIIIVIVLYKIIFERKIWYHLFEKRKILKEILLKEILERNKSNNKFCNKHHSTAAAVYSIAVSKEFRGSNIAMQLLNALIDEMEKKGVECCRLGTYSNNKRAINFYKKAGWRIEKKTDKTVVFIKHLKSKK